MEPVSTLYFGPFILDGTDDSLWRGQERCKLTAKAGAVLRHMVAHPGRLVRKADLLATVWPGLHVSDWVLTTCIREIRQVLGDAAKTPQYIATVHRQGYRFIAPVTVVAAPPPATCTALPAVETPPSAPTAIVPEAEHKLVTILSGALAKAPALAAELGSERWYRLLQTVLGLTREVLQHYGGSLTLATGDGFTAVFGAPVAQEDHARRAVLAALELCQRLHDAPVLYPQLAGDVLSLSIGLHSGQVVVGELGSDLQATAIGTPLHVATRLQQQAAPGTILLSAATYRLVHADVQAAPCGTLDLDGQPSPVSVYAVQGLRQRHAGVAGRGLRTLSPFVGRERELALLYDHLATAVGGQGQVVGVVGAPGMGKTRLLTEFCIRVSGNQVTVYEGQCLSYGQATPYLPVRDIVRQICGLAEEAEPAMHTAAVQQRLHESGMTAADDVALLLHLLETPVDPESLARLSPEARQARTFALLRHLVLDAAQKQPLILVVENLHWSDPTSAAWLASLVERLPEAAVLLLATYRPGDQPAWGAHAAVTQIALSPLHGPDSRTVVQSVLGAVALPEARLQTMVAQAEGNPFFLEELAWDAVEQNDQRTPGTVPETVHAVLAARMDRLPSEARRLLQMAAVIGPEVPVPLLQTLAEFSEDTLHRGLADLQAAEFLYETRLFPEPVYSFKHALTHEVAYGSLLQERRRTLHARIVEILEALSPNRLAEQVERLAHHALRGKVWDKALSYLYQAGRKAEVQSVLLARDWFEQALGVLAILPESPATLEQGFEIRFGLRSALAQLGEVRLGLEHLREAEALAERLHDDHRQGRVYASMTIVHVLLGEPEAALVTGAQALEIAGRLGDLRLRLLTTTRIAQAHYYRGDYHRVVVLGTDFLATLSADRVPKHVENPLLMSLYCRYWLVMSLAEMGRFTEATAYATEAIRLAEPTQHAHYIGRVHFAAGRLHLLQGDWARGRAHFERGIVAYREGHIFLSLHRVVAASAWVLAQVGETGEALTRLRKGWQLIERQAARGAVDQHGGDYHALGRAALLLGRLDEAQRLGDHALKYSPSHHGFAAHALHLLGDIATHPDRFDAKRGEAYYRQALALAEPRSMRPLMAHCHHGLGRIYAQSGRAEQARAELTTAIDLYHAMGMTFWLPQAEAALAQIGAADGPVGSVPCAEIIFDQQPAGG